MKEGLLVVTMVLVEARFLGGLVAFMEVEAWLRVEDGICERKSSSVAVLLPAAWRIVSGHGWSMELLSDEAQCVA